MTLRTCKYCLRPIDLRGMQAHVHFKHRVYVAREFYYNPVVWIEMWAAEGWLPPRYPVALPPPDPLTVYPHVAGMLAPPSHKMPRWV